MCNESAQAGVIDKRDVPQSRFSLSGMILQFATDRGTGAVPLRSDKQSHFVAYHASIQNIGYFIQSIGQ
jgi:hypothetical protein